MRTLRPVHPNAGIAAMLRQRMIALLDRMADDYARTLLLRYKRNPPKMAQDERLPAHELQAELRKLGARWEKEFNGAAPRLAKWFLTAVHKRSEKALQKILRDAGISVRFKMTRAMRDVLGGSVNESVSLIKSIQQQYHGEIEGLVMRSVVAGRDLAQITTDLHERYGVTRKRAILIARDQNNKATAAMTRARYEEAGIEQAVWLHSHGGKEPRKTHLRNSGKRYNVAEGWFDPDPRVRRNIWPGELINCRCVAKPVVPGLS